MSTVAILSKYANEGRKIAEHTAFKLGYPLVTMDDLAKAASKESNIPENEFLKALKDVSFYHHLFRKRKMKLVSLMELKLCEIMAKKPIVFAGTWVIRFSRKFHTCWKFWCLYILNLERRKMWGALIGFQMIRY
jgi:hypothetical protein